MHMRNFDIVSETAFLYHAAYLCRESKTGTDGAWEIAPFQCSIPYEDDCLASLDGLKRRLETNFPSLLEFGQLRANKAFVSKADSVTKPSYIARIENYLGTKINQLENVLNIAEIEPASGGLVFSVFSPEDLLNRRRPGYVPCLVSGSFLLHDGELHLNAFFRSQSIVEFGLFDLIFLRTFQKLFMDKYCERSIRSDKIRQGPLNMHFGRIIIQRRLMRQGTRFVKRSDVIDSWINEIEAHLIENRMH